MKSLNRIAHFTTALIILSIALNDGWAADPKTQLVDSTKTLLAQQKNEEALRQLDAAPAELQNDSNALFLRGVAYQQLASQLQGSAKSDALKQAEEAYKRSLVKTPAPPPPPNPSSGGGGPRPEPITTHVTDAATANNLASLYAGMGNDTEARRYFQQAIDSGDARRGYYALNFARYLESRDPTQAIAVARVAVASAPQSREARDFLGQLLWRNRIDDMLSYATSLSQQGFSDAAIQWSIKCLKSGNRPSDERRAWLTMVARIATMTARYEDAIAKLRGQLEELQGDPDIGAGASQLRNVLQTPPADRQAIRWWVEQRDKLTAVNTSPRATMRELLLALAERNKDANATSEKYLLAGIELGDRGPDPDVFLRLVELYAGSNQIDKLKSLMDRYQYELFSEKSAAYARNDWPLIYRMHVALGMTYAHLQVWTSNSQFQNAIFQLEAAQQAAERLNQQAERARKPERIALPPVAVQKLADGYASIQRNDLAVKVRLDGASNLQKSGFTRESEDVLANISEQQAQALSPEAKLRLQTLKTTAMQVR